MSSNVNKEKERLKSIKQNWRCQVLIFSLIREQKKKKTKEVIRKNIYERRKNKIK